MFSTLQRRQQQSSEIHQKISLLDVNHDLSQRINIITQDDLGEVANLVNQTFARLREDFIQLQSSSAEIATASTQTAAATRQSKSNLQKQKENLANALSSVEEINLKIENDIANINQAADNAEQSKTSAIDGEEAVKEAVKGIKHTANEVANVGSVIEALNQRVSSIQGMVDVIRSVAEQTNLLALNAAIEAARAGDQGRGFAVVADEVRSLAQRTQQSTEEISKMVDLLTESSETAFESIEKGNSQASRAVELAENINTILSDVTREMTSLDQITHEISDSAEEQKRYVLEVTNNIRNIDNQASENSTAAEQIAEASQLLSSSADQMLERVTAYKV